jgi:hypothetical protein
MATLTLPRRERPPGHIGMIARIRAARAQIISALLVIAGLGGALGGGWLVGRWCLGLVLIIESAGALWLGLMREDGTALPRRGDRTVAEVLHEESSRYT